ncbi:MAG: hypothetical protein NY202_04105 [Mollicutes bacterium UO1]
MVNDNNQEAEFNNASYKNNKKRKLKSRKREGKSFAFLVYLFFNLGGEGRFFYLFLAKHPP